MFSSDAFSYINVLDKTMDASWQRETVLANNLANVDTPGYKRQDVEFSSILEFELTKTQYGSVDGAVKHVDLDRVDAVTYTDNANYSYRIDENNVDVDSENVELASEQIRYQTLSSATKQEFTRFSTVCTSS